MLRYYCAPMFGLMVVSVAISRWIPDRLQAEPWRTALQITALITTYLVIIRGMHRGGMLARTYPKYVWNRILFGFMVFGLVFTISVATFLGLQQARLELSSTF